MAILLHGDTSLVPPTQDDLAAAQAASRPKLPKSTVMARAAALNRFDAIWKIMTSQPLLQAQWFSPDWPDVFCDDAGMLQVLQAAGCSDDDIATITASV